MGWDGGERVKEVRVVEGSGRKRSGRMRINLDGFILHSLNLTPIKVECEFTTSQDLRNEALKAKTRALVTRSLSSMNFLMAWPCTSMSSP